MNKNPITMVSIFLFSVFVGIFLVSCETGNGTPTAVAGVTSDGQTLMQERCSVCHTTNRIISAQKTAAEWTTTVDRMLNHGAQLSAVEKQTLIDYLAATYK